MSNLVLDAVNLPLLIGACVLVALGLIAAVVAVVVSRKKSKNVADNAESQPEPAADEPVKDVPETEEEPQAAEAAEVKAEDSAEVTEAQTESEEEEADEPDDGKESFADEESETDKPVRSVAKIDGHVRYIIIKYKKSFTAKLIQSDDSVKSEYSQIKNELLSYDGIKARMSWKCETFYSGRTTYAKLCIRGKRLGLFLALDPKKYADTKYIVDDMTEVAAYGKTPCLYRIKNARRLKYSADLIADAMSERRKADGYEAVDWAGQYPYEEIEPLIERNLVKVLTEEDAQSGDVFKPRDFVAAQEVNELLTDTVAMALVEDTDEISDKTKSGIVNIDTLGKYFNDGETVTLEEIKKRVPNFQKSVTYIKVLARGVLDKRLKVVADAYSTEAIKMILLTGGDAVRKKSK